MAKYETFQQTFYENIRMILKIYYIDINVQPVWMVEWNQRISFPGQRELSWKMPFFFRIFLVIVLFILYTKLHNFTYHCVLGVMAVSISNRQPTSSAIMLPYATAVHSALQINGKSTHVIFMIFDFRRKMCTISLYLESLTAQFDTYHLPMSGLSGNWTVFPRHFYKMAQRKIHIVYRSWGQ